MSWVEYSAYLTRFAGLTIAVAMFFAGCSADKHAIATYPISGQVTFKGKPA